MNYLEDSPRVVLVIGNAAVAHPSLSHDGGVETYVGESGAARTAAWVLSTCELAYGGISSILLFDLASLLVSDEKEYASCYGCNSNEPNNNTCSDSSLACTA